MIVLDVWSNAHVIENIHNEYENVFFIKSSNMTNVCVCWNNDEIIQGQHIKNKVSNNVSKIGIDLAKGNDKTAYCNRMDKF